MYQFALCGFIFELMYSFVGSGHEAYCSCNFEHWVQLQSLSRICLPSVGGSVRSFQRALTQIWSWPHLKQLVVVLANSDPYVRVIYALTMTNAAHNQG